MWRITGRLKLRFRTRMRAVGGHVPAHIPGCTLKGKRGAPRRGAHQPPPAREVANSRAGLGDMRSAASHKLGLTRRPSKAEDPI